jgi:hypothetical protein
MEDCNCDRRFCKHINSNDSRSVKAEKLYTTLPAFIKADESVIDLWKSMQLEVVMKEKTKIGGVYGLDYRRK